MSKSNNINWPTLVLYVLVVVPWVMGIAVAKGFWLTLLCGLLPPFAWVLTATHFMEMLS